MIEQFYLSDFLNLDVGWVLDAQVAGHPLHDSFTLCLYLNLEAGAYSGGKRVILPPEPLRGGGGGGISPHYL